METMEIQTKKSSKSKASAIAMTVALSLAIVKAFVGIFTGSLAIISSAVDSILDVFASLFNFLAIRTAEKPADSKHQYGHGKYESLAAFIQSIVIFVSGIFILMSAYRNIKNNEHPEITSAGITIMFISIIVTVCLTVYLRYMSKKEKSKILEADSMHYSIDLYTNIGILASLFIIKFTGYDIIDSIVAIIIALFIMYSAIRLSFDVSKELVDSSISKNDFNKIVEILDGFHKYNLDFHNIRSRMSGSTIFVDMHLNLCKYLSLEQVHRITDIVEFEIGKEIPHADVTIHPEPCDHERNHVENCQTNELRESIKILDKEYREKYNI